MKDSFGCSHSYGDIVVRCHHHKMMACEPFRHSKDSLSYEFPKQQCIRKIRHFVVISQNDPQVLSVTQKNQDYLIHMLILRYVFPVIHFLWPASTGIQRDESIAVQILGSGLWHKISQNIHKNTLVLFLSQECINLIFQLMAFDVCEAHSKAL